MRRRRPKTHAERLEEQIQNFADCIAAGGDAQEMADWRYEKALAEQQLADLRETEGRRS